jgi:MFS family permease
MLENESAAAKEGGRRRRLALLLLVLINLFNYLDRYVLAAVITRVGAAFLHGDTAEKAKLGALATVFLVSYMVLSPVFGMLGDRYARWKLIGLGVMIWSLASGASGLATGYWVLLATRAVVGVGEAAYGPVAPTLIADLFPVEARGRVMSWFYMAIPVGSALGYTLGGLADEHLNWRWGFYLVVPPGMLLGILCFLMPEPPRGPATESHARIKLADYTALLRNRSYVWNTLAMTALTFAIGGIAYWMPDYISMYRKAGELGHVNKVFGVITVITGITATLSGGLVADWLRGKVKGSYFVVSGVALALAFPMLLLMLYRPFPMAWLWIFMCEFCLFFNTGPSNAALANVTKASVRATAFAVNIFMIHALGDAISPAVIGFIADQTGDNMNLAFGVVGVVVLVGAACWLIGSRYLDRDTAVAEAT